MVYQGGVLIQLKQAGAAGQLPSIWWWFTFTSQCCSGGGAAAVGGIIPALGVIIAPKYVGKAMLDPKFQELAFKSAVKPLIGQKANTPTKKNAICLQSEMLGRLVTLGVIPEAEAAKEVKDGIQKLFRCY